MDEFYLESPDALRKLASQLQRASDDAVAGQRHVEKYAALTLPEEGILLDTMASHEHAYDMVRGAMEVIAVRTKYAAHAINQTTDAYEFEDEEARRRLDRAFRGLSPGTPLPIFSQYQNLRRGEAFSDVAEPSDKSSSRTDPLTTGRCSSSTRRRTCSARRR